MKFLKKNNDIISWWKHKSILFNLITLSYIFLYLLLDNVFRPHSFNPLIIPAITGYIVLTNLYYYAILFLTLIVSKNKISNKHTRTIYKSVILSMLLISMAYSLVHHTNYGKASFSVAVAVKSQNK